MQTHVQKTATAVYDRVTAAWRLLLGEDLHYGLFVGPADTLELATQRLTMRMAEWAALGPADKVLDVGCGIGNPARFLARQFGCNVVGISNSTVGVSMAQELAAIEKVGGVQFCVRDGMATNFPACSFDCAWIMESSHLMAHKNAFIGECARVLRPGGRLVLCDIIMRQPLPFSELVKNLRKFRCLDSVFGQAKMETLGTYRRLLETNELSVSRLEDLSDLTYRTFECWLARAYKNKDKVVELVGEPYWREFTEACEYLAALWQNGSLGYGIVLAIKAA